MLTLVKMLETGSIGQRSSIEELQFGIICSCVFQKKSDLDGKETKREQQKITGHVGNTQNNLGAQVT